MTKAAGLPTVTVFGSSSAREGSDAWKLAEALGVELAWRGFAVCNGGYGGTMLAAARAARQAGGTTIGVTLSGAGWPRANPWIAREIPCASLPERIATLLELGDAYVVLQGGTGTLAELGLTLEMAGKQLLPAKAIVFLGGFWTPLLELLGTEEILRGEPAQSAVEGVKTKGRIACTDSAGAAAEFLSLSLA